MRIDIEDPDLPEIVLDDEPPTPAPGLVHWFAVQAGSPSDGRITRGPVPNPRPHALSGRRARIVPLASAGMVAISIIAVAALPNHGPARESGSGSTTSVAAGVWQSPSVSGGVPACRR